MIKILFVCHGNICRSPMGEFILKDMVIKGGYTVVGINDAEAVEGKGVAASLADKGSAEHLAGKGPKEADFEIASAATSREEIGNPVYPPAKRELASRDIGTSDNDLGVSQKRARQVTEADLEYYDYIICMDHNNLRNMRRMFGEEIDTRGNVKLMLDFAGRQGEEVADPWYTGDFEATWNDVVEGCEGLLNEIL